MLTIKELITETANSQLNNQDTVTVRGIEEEIRREYPEVLQEYAATLAAKGLIRDIKAALKNLTSQDEKNEKSQLRLPGINPPSVITNPAADEGEYKYIRIDKATHHQLIAYDYILRKNVLNAVERRRDLNLKITYLSPAFEYNPDFTVAEACQWLDNNQHVNFSPQASCTEIISEATA